jgi:hypothetical protein
MPDRLPFLPDEHYYAITNVVARAAQLDHSLYFSLAFQLSDKRHLMKYLIANVDLNRLIKVLHAALLDNFPAKHDEINTLIKSINVARADRNDLIHWLWQKTDDPEKITLADMRPHKSEATKTKTSADIYALAQACLDAVAALHSLDFELMRRRDMRPQEVASLETLLQQTLQPSSAWPENPDQPRGDWPPDRPQPPFPEKSEP